jgi:hypothetical protein
MWSACVRLDGPDQFEPVFPQDAKVALDLVVDRIDDRRLARGLIEHQIGIGTGRGIEKLDRSRHGGLPLAC